MTSLASLHFGDLLSQIAAKTPAPGGGAVACATGALAASLAHMVVSYSLGKKSLAAHQDSLQHASAALKRANQLLLELADEDAHAYALVNELMRLPETDPRRQQEWGAAIDASIQIPMAAIATCADLLRLAETLAPITNTMLHSDLAIAAVLAESAARASRWNVLVNVAALPADRRTPILAEADRILESAAARARAVERACTH
jgi:formiminotetrahydrofolate cyclodeaminase